MKHTLLTTTLGLLCLWATAHTNCDSVAQSYEEYISETHAEVEYLETRVQELTAQAALNQTDNMPSPESTNLYFISMGIIIFTVVLLAVSITFILLYYDEHKRHKLLQEKVKGVS